MIEQVYQMVLLLVMIEGSRLVALLQSLVWSADDGSINTLGALRALDPQIVPLLLARVLQDARPK